MASMLRLRDEDNESLVEPITIDDMIAVAVRNVSKQSRPGSDGFGYTFLYHLHLFPPLQEIITRVYNGALTYSKFSDS